jgi:DNA-directed RNA polymerase subunit M/transcription elongation factor TFIIS
MIQLKACPKCQGDFYLTEDSFGKFLSCFQCGYIKDLELAAADAQAEREANRSAVAEEHRAVAA